MVACQAPLFMEFFRQKYWSGLPFPSPGDLPNLGIKTMSLLFPALAGGFFTTSATWEAPSTKRRHSDTLLRKLNKILYIEIPRIMLGIKYALKQFRATVSCVLALVTDLSIVLRNTFLLYGFLSLVLFMTALCLCQAFCLWLTEFCFLKMRIAFDHFQSTGNLPFYICFSKIIDRSLSIPVRNSLCTLSSNVPARRLENI